MVTFNPSVKQMTAKVVYYGPGLCGKTTNLNFIYSKLSPKARGEMVSLNTETDRTLFFDLLPLEVGVIGGFKTKVQLYTVPGQVFYDATRKLVLRGADGVVFVADSQETMLDANKESMENLRVNLKEHGVNLDEIPLVIQWNKRDMKTALPIEVLERELNPRGVPAFPGVASEGKGVFDVLKAITKSSVEFIKKNHFGEDGEPDLKGDEEPEVQPVVPPRKAAVEHVPAPVGAGSRDHEKSASAALDMDDFDDSEIRHAVDHAPADPASAEVKPIASAADYVLGPLGGLPPVLEVLPVPVDAPSMMAAAPPEMAVATVGDPFAMFGGEPAPENIAEEMPVVSLGSPVAEAFDSPPVEKEALPEPLPLDPAPKLEPGPESEPVAAQSVIAMDPAVAAEASPVVAAEPIPVPVAVPAKKPAVAIPGIPKIGGLGAGMGKPKPLGGGPKSVDAIMGGLTAGIGIKGVPAGIKLEIPQDFEGDEVEVIVRIVGRNGTLVVEDKAVKKTPAQGSVLKVQVDVKRAQG